MAHVKAIRDTLSSFKLAVLAAKNDGLTVSCKSGMSSYSGLVQVDQDQLKPDLIEISRQY